MPRKPVPPATPKAPAKLPASKRKQFAHGLLRKSARLGATVVAARVAAGTGKKGVFGLIAGAGAKRLIMRYPAGALFVTGAYLAGKVFEAKREVERKRNQKLLTDESAKPILIDEARKARGR
jgi:hypothetical protein